MRAERTMKHIDVERLQGFMRRFKLKRISEKYDISYSTLCRVSHDKNIKDISTILCYYLSKATGFTMEEITEIIYDIN